MYGGRKGDPAPSDGLVAAARRRGGGLQGDTHRETRWGSTSVLSVRNDTLLFLVLLVGTLMVEMHLLQGVS